MSLKNDSVDFHKTVAIMANISRDQAKTINLGLFYGMGKAKLQAELGLNSKEEAENLFNQYHTNVPFVKELMNKTSAHAQSSGSIGTLLGRRCRFNKWEPATFGMHTAMSFEEAERTYGRGRIRRAMTYKALNKLIQGSAADMTKKAMLDLYNEGIVPHIQIHDELDISVIDDNHAKKIVEIMESGVTLAIPNKVDYESGETWGDILWLIMAYLNANIPPIYCKIRREYLYDLRKHQGEVEDCVVFGLGSISGRALLFHCLLTNGAIYWRLPISAFVQRRSSDTLHQAHRWNIKISKIFSYGIHLVIILVLLLLIF
jgi:hypothetical protein